MSDDSLRPIIIKRKKVSGGDGHHGGAWKVAYADFVTAMMAFFMLMWLLNATTEKQRKGLADYFSPTIAIARVSGGGDGAFGGDSLASEEVLAQSGRGGVLELPTLELNTSEASDDSEQSNEAETEVLEALMEGLAGKGGDSLVQEMAKKHITARMTDEGLIIEISDLEGSPLFDDATNQPTAVLRTIGQVLMEAFRIVSNKVAVSAHSSAYPDAIVSNPAWRITTDRAQAMRGMLEDNGLDRLRVARVVGYGQQEANPSDPMAVENNRLEIILLRSTEN